MHPLILVAAVLLAGASPDLEPVKAYVGKHALDKVGGHEGFFAVPYVAETLQSLLSKNEARLLARLEVRTPVEQGEGFIFTSVCRPHGCPSEHAVVAIDARSGATYVAFWNWKSGASWVSKHGRTQAAPAEVPCAVLAEFHYGHVPRMTAADQWCERNEPQPR